MDTKEKTAEEFFRESFKPDISSQTNWNSNFKHFNTFDMIQFAEAYAEQKLSALQASPAKEVEKPESTSFKDFLIKRVGKENYIKHFPNHYSEIEIIYAVNDYVSPLQSRIQELDQAETYWMNEAKTKGVMIKELEQVIEVQNLAIWKVPLQDKIKSLEAENEELRTAAEFMLTTMLHSSCGWNQYTEMEHAFSHLRAAVKKHYAVEPPPSKPEKK